MNTETKQIHALFQENRFAEVGSLIKSKRFSAEVDSDDTGLTYWMAAISFYEEKDYLSTLEYSVKVSEYMTRDGLAGAVRDTFDELVNVTINSYFRLDRPYEALKFIRHMEGRVGAEFPRLADIREDILQRVAISVQRRISVIVAVGLIIQLFILRLLMDVSLLRLVLTSLVIALVLFVLFFPNGVVKAIKTWLRIIA